MRALVFCLALPGCGFDVTTPPIRLQFLDAEGRAFVPKREVEVRVNARISSEGAAADVFESKTVKLAPTKTVIAPLHLVHDSGSEPSLEIEMPSSGEIVASDDGIYQCRATVQVSNARLQTKGEQLVHVGCDQQPNRIRAASYACEGGQGFLALDGTFAELRRVPGKAAFTDEIAATLRAKLRFADERAPFAEILLQFSRTNVVGGVADAKHIVKAVAYSVPAARDFRFPEALQRLSHGMDAGFASAEDPRAPDEVGKVMPKTNCRAADCRMRFLWPVIPVARKAAEVSVHLDRAGRLDPSFRITVVPCEAAPTPDAGP